MELRLTCSKFLKRSCEIELDTGRFGKRRFGKRRFGKNMAADVSAEKYAETPQAKNICRYVSYDIWGISGV